MKKSNKILAIILAILMVISIIPITASAATKSGTCGENVKWTYDDTTYILTISGTGPMEKNGYGLLFASLTPEVQKVIICDGVTSICNTAFQQCRYLTDVSIPNTVTVIGNHAFYNCPKLTNVTLPNSVTSIDNYAFGMCDGFTSIALPDSVTTIGNYAFRGCQNLKSITIPDSVTSIGEGAFASCARLADVKIPDGITTIKEGTFDGCARLLSITIPKSVTTIEAYAFHDCHLLMNVYYLGTKEEWEAISIEQSNTTNKYLLNTTIHYHTHNYSSEVTVQTCTEQGYTTYTCECGETYVDDYVDATGHSYTSKITTPATHTATGVMTYTCTCGDTYTEVIEKIAEHTYESVVTAPTCTEQGFTTYTCECGDTYVDYVDALGHTSANAVEENYVAPTCTENGSKDVVVYCSVCNEEISRETVVIKATGHADNDNDGYCDADNELLDPTIECECNCHNDGISGFFWRLINVFNMLFGLNKTCECGVSHY